MGTRIKDVALVGSVSEGYKIPISDGSNQPKTASVGQIGEFVNQKYGVEQKLSELDLRINGDVIPSNQEVIKVEGENFFAGKYYNTGAYNLSIPQELASVSCWQIPCKSGDTFKIYSKCSSSAVVQLWAFWKKNLALVGKSNITEITSFRDEPLVVTAPADAAFLTINMLSYNADTDKVYKSDEISKSEIKSAIERVEKHEEILSRIDTGASALSLKGKTIVCFGDSITEYSDYNGKRYSDYIAEYTGANVINVGVGGSRLEARAEVMSSPSNVTQAYAALDVISMVNAAVEQNFEKQFAAANSGLVANKYLPIVERLSSINFSEVDAITFFAGTNSWRTSRAFGTAGQRDNDYYTLSAVNLMISKLSKTYPHIKIYWFLPIVRWIDNNGFTEESWCDNFALSGYLPGGESFTLEQFNSAVKAEVVKNHIPVCDLYNELGINKFNFWNYFPNTSVGDIETDGTHPKKGMNVIAKKMMAFITSNLLF